MKVLTKRIAASIVVFAATVCAAYTIKAITASAQPFIEFKRSATIADVVLVAKAAESGMVPNNQNGIRYDVDFDGDVDSHDVDLLADYILMKWEFDTVIDAVSDEAVEVLDLFTMEIAETYAVSPDEFTVYPMCWSIADGGITGFAVSDEPYTGDILYDFDHETGDIILCTMVQIGDMVRWDEFDFGNLSEFGFSYTPRQEVVANALRNLD